MKAGYKSLLLTLGLVAAPALPQTAPLIGHSDKLVTVAAPATGGATLQVTTSAFAPGADIPRDNTQYGANAFPALTWSAGPAGTRSYAVIVQGTVGRTTADGGGTSIHLTVYNIPAGTTALPAGFTTPPAGAVFGANVHGPHASYAGPHTHNAVKHEYHFQVLALDKILPAGDVDFDALVQAMQGHVLASGDVVGLAAMPADAAEAKPPAAPVRIDTGLVVGAPGRDASVTVYKGIPHAAPPVGALRWKPPAPAAAWQGVRQADKFGALCPQPVQGDAAARVSEDCLTLNVWSAAKSPGEKRPVYVWIYGGGFIQGSGANPGFDGEGLARKGVVVVTFNYRLGVLGFLATPELSWESGHHASGNYGLMDDIAALKWVQRNIAAFGGDPDRVTIGGQSAGAGSVGFMTLSPLAKGLFRHSIAESHARDPRDPELRYLSVSYRTLRNAEASGTAYAAGHGAKSLAALRAMPWQKLIEGSDTIDAAVDTRSTGKPPLFRPVVDGWIVPLTYDQALKRGAHNDVVYVAGNNLDETGAVPETAFAAMRAQGGDARAGMPQTSVTLAGYKRAAGVKFGAMADEFLRLYPASSDAEAALANNEAARDNSRISTFLWAQQWSKSSTRPVYTYFWTHAPPGPGHDQRGAYHGSEINYAFNNLYATNRPWTDEDRQIADTMSSYWANIIKTGNPNGPGLPDWPRYDPASNGVMRLGEGWGMIPIARPDRVDFWKRFFQTQQAW